MGLRSFVRPASTATARAPARGDRAPELPGGAAGQPHLVAFLRHTGCPFAEATMRELRELAAVAGDVELVAVTHSPPAATAAWCARVGGDSGVRVITDPDRALYGRWGLGRTSLRHFAGARSLGAVARQARHGIRNTRAHGTRWQTAGTFAVDADEIVRWRHIPEHAGELPDLAAALESLQL